ncbi:MAG TPA: CDP-diacylglycerol--glycerol-3-phosphate 3-phosphatidyltransferase, partial [Pedococcus sp.]|nr:CDP-diacylglycerol--glycerol-3-phosphate 3-phosphatidyltransferase [Pedococcus sp.]
LPLWSFPGADAWVLVARIVIGLAVVVTVVTGVDIVVKALRMRQTSERSAMKRARRAAARQERAGRQERASR